MQEARDSERGCWIWKYVCLLGAAAGKPGSGYETHRRAAVRGAAGLELCLL